MTIGHLFADISHWQKVFDWEKYSQRIKEYNEANNIPNYVVAGIRAGSVDNVTGVCYSDYQWENNANGAVYYCDEIWFYWYFRPNHSPEKQAEFYTRLILDRFGALTLDFDRFGAFMVSTEYPNLKLRIFGDCEVSGGLTPGIVADRIWSFVLDIMAAAEGYTGMYTRQSWWDSSVSNKYPWGYSSLWAARYKDGMTSPWSDGNYKVRDWETWHAWQFSADGNGRGREFGAQSDDIDLNYANGLFETEPEPTEDPPVTIDYTPVLTRIAAALEAGNELLDELITAVLGADTPGDPGEPGPGPLVVKYRVDTTGKPNNRVKVRPAPNQEAHDYVFHGDMVGATIDRVLLNHAHITWDDKREIIPGYVELEFLVKQ